MADISQIKLPNNTTLDLKDAKKKVYISLKAHRLQLLAHGLVILIFQMESLEQIPRRHVMSHLEMVFS